MTVPPWLPFWRRSAWSDWRARRRAWTAHRAAGNAPGERPARPVSPLWAPATGLAVLVALAAAGGGEGDQPGPSSTPATTADLTSTTAAPTPTEAPSTTAAAPRATTVAPTSTLPTTTTVPPPTTTMLPDGPLLAAPVAGPSGDPTAPLPAGAEVVTVVEVIDGDTLDVARAGGSVATVRLIGTNSPEQDECLAGIAAEVLAVLAAPGGTVGLTMDESDLDQFDRLLRYVWLGGMSVNEETVRRGAAIARRYEPDTAMADRLEAAQADAQRESLGLWAPDACGPPADAGLAIVEVRYDAPGDDNVNLNEEWATIRNDGANPVDLTGWVLKDESATHRYAFPPGFSLAPGEEARVMTGCGPDFGTDLHWCNQGSAVWNNDGDTAFLLDPNGNVHDTHRYEG